MGTFPLLPVMGFWARSRGGFRELLGGGSDCGGTTLEATRVICGPVIYRWHPWEPFPRESEGSTFESLGARGVFHTHQKTNTLTTKTKYQKTKTKKTLKKKNALGFKMSKLTMCW